MVVDMAVDLFFNSTKCVDDHRVIANVFLATLLNKSSKNTTDGGDDSDDDRFHQPNIFFQVTGPTTPSPLRPFAFCHALTAAAVTLPN